MQTESVIKILLSLLIDERGYNEKSHHKASAMKIFFDKLWPAGGSTNDQILGRRQ